MRRIWMTVGAIVTSVALAFALAGCGSETPAETAPSNDVLLTFGQAGESSNSESLAVDSTGVVKLMPALEEGAAEISLVDADGTAILTMTLDPSTSPLQFNVDPGDYTLEVTSTGAQGQVRVLGTLTPDHPQPAHEE